MILRSDCTKLHSQHRHGNLLYGLYSMHLAAVAHDGTDFLFICTETKQYDNLFWWLQSDYSTIELKRSLLLLSSSSESSPQVDDHTAGSANESTDKNGTTFSNTKAINRKLSKRAACQGMGKIPLQFAEDLIRYDLRRMALAIFGTRPNRTDLRPYQSVSDKLPEPSLFPTEEIDSVAIHFRCGDVLSNLNQGEKASYGLLPFYVYRDMLHRALANDDETIDTIGIVTAPFQPHLLRREDIQYASQCQELTESLRDYLQSAFVGTRVTIRNSPNDTIPMVYSRLILASKVSICIRSTFCVFPTLSSFARKRVFLEGGVNYFVADDNSSGLQVWSAKSTPYLLSHEIHQLEWEGTKEWLLQTTPINATIS